jgi:hypothetical protein
MLDEKIKCLQKYKKGIGIKELIGVLEHSVLLSESSGTCQCTLA